MPGVSRSPDQPTTGPRAGPAQNAQPGERRLRYYCREWVSPPPRASRLRPQLARTVHHPARPGARAARPAGDRPGRRRRRRRRPPPPKPAGPDHRREPDPSRARVLERIRERLGRHEPGHGGGASVDVAVDAHVSLGTGGCGEVEQRRREVPPCQHPPDVTGRGPGQLAAGRLPSRQRLGDILVQASRRGS